MALSTQSSVLAKRRATNWITAIGGKPFTQGAMKWFWSFVSQFLGNPDMQIVEFSALGANVVLMDAACKLFAIVMDKATATLSYAKFTDNATTGSTDGTQNITIPVKGVASEAVLFYPQGFALASGLAAVGNTTPTGNTSSAANGANGFVVLGGA